MAKKTFGGYKYKKFTGKKKADTIAALGKLKSSSGKMKMKPKGWLKYAAIRKAAGDPYPRKIHFMNTTGNVATFKHS